MHNSILLLLQNILVGTSLAADAFSISLCMGLAHSNLSKKNATSLAIAFGGFQFLMPILGGILALFFGKLFGSYAKYISAALICYVGGNMLKEAFSAQSTENTKNLSLDTKNILLLAVATSLDAFAVGFSVALRGTSPLLVAIAAGIITYILSYIGALLGKVIGAGIGKRGEILGGVVLLCIAFTMLID